MLLSVIRSNLEESEAVVQVCVDILNSINLKNSEHIICFYIFFSLKFVTKGTNKNNSCSELVKAF